MPPKLTLQQQHDVKPPSAIEGELNVLKTGKETYQPLFQAYKTKFDQYKTDWTTYTTGWDVPGLNNNQKIDLLNALVRKQNDYLRAQDDYLKAQHDLIILATNAVLFVQRFLKKLFKL